MNAPRQTNRQGIKAGKPAAHTVAKERGADAAVMQELRPGQSIELLQELHILTREGKLNQDSRRKLKQGVPPVQFH